MAAARTSRRSQTRVAVGIAAITGTVATDGIDVKAVAIATVGSRGEAKSTGEATGAIANIDRAIAAMATTGSRRQRSLLAQLSAARLPTSLPERSIAAAMLMWNGAMRATSHTARRTTRSSPTTGPADSAIRHTAEKAILRPAARRAFLRQILKSGRLLKAVLRASDQPSDISR